jgi:hypothetical protein
MGHFALLGVYDVLHRVSGPLDAARNKLPMSKEQRYRWNRQLEAWEFGSGSDYRL